MDDTQTSRASDATRKRRSSILKSQRPPRTPFSELEFNVATPTDSAKSRRVSFSRRTGVAEFVTNEATTTWKNFYEEHNKSLESSGNDSGSKAVGHLGKRAFDQQFEEVEADFIGTLNSGPNINISSSLNNFEQQLASLECTDDIKLTAPLNKFELSAFTNHTKLFDDLAITCGEVTDRIDINFSAVQQIGGNDDLDEIQKDLKQNFGQVPFERQNISEYIEVDLNTTQCVKNDDDNMSITDTIQSPKVQDVSKNNSTKNTEKDWVVDKENIAMNPYVAPRESEDFAINEEPDKVLVFDGKRLTLQSEQVDKENYRQTLLPYAPDKAPQRKTIVLNVNDDLPNFLDDPYSNTSGFVGINELKKSMIIDDISITEPLQDFKKNRTVLYDDELGNISVTKVVPTNMVPEDNGRTVLYEDNTGNISITQAIPTNIAEKQKTIIFDKNDSDISITQALPTNVQETKPNIQHNDKRNTIVFDNCDISMTQAMPAHILPEKSTKRRTIVYEDNEGNLSLTQAVPNLLITEAKTENRRTIVYEDETGNISVTQAIPSNIIADNPDRRRTVVFESDTGNISVTQAVPSNLIWQENVNMDISETKMVPAQIIAESSRRRTIVYEKDTGNLSITQAVPNQVIEEISTQNQIIAMSDGCDAIKNKRRTIVFDNDDVDVTEAISNLVFSSQNKNALMDNSLSYVKPINNATNRRTVVFDKDDVDISMTQAVPTNIIHSLNQNNKAEATNKRRTVVFEDDDADISMTQAVNVNQLIPGFKQNVHDDLEAALNEALHTKDAARGQRTVVYEDNTNISISQNLQDKNEISISQSLRDNVMKNAVKRRTLTVEDNNISLKQALPVTLAESDAIHDVSMTEVNAKENDFIDTKADVSTTKATHRAEKTLRESLKPEHRSGNSVTTPLLSSPLKVHSENRTKLDESYNQTMESNTKGVSQVLIYQAAFTRTDHDESQNQEPIASNDELLSTSSKNVPDVEQSSTSSKTTDAIEDKDLSTQIPTRNQPEINDDKSYSSETSKSILDDLLDMSRASADGIDDKGIMARIDEPKKETDCEQVKAKPCADTNSNDTLFYITRDADDESTSHKDVQQLTDRSPLPLDYKESPKIIKELQNTLGNIKNKLKDENSPENIPSSDLNKSKIKLDKTQLKKSFKSANDTSELLEMLSELTDKTMTRKPEGHVAKDEDEEPKPLLVKGRLALENKSEDEPRRLSFAPRRQSIAMSREDLLNNISMAGAALKSRLDFDDSELEDTVKDSPEERSPKKSVRLSNEVVKTLHFDDDDTTVSDTQVTPLKKTAFGETTYMQDHKPHKVIPDYLKDVADGIKELMDDLVKPNADVLPFDTLAVDKHVKKIPSTCSTQIQANLITSSQVDLNTGLYSNTDSAYNVNVDKICSMDMINDAVNRSVSRALKTPIKTSIVTDKSDKSIDDPEAVMTFSPRRQTEAKPGRVLIFDHNNPLNNVLLAPDTCTEVHKYNPCQSTETICASERSHSAQISINENEKVSTQYNVDNIVHSMQQSGDASSGKLADSQSLLSTLSKPMSMDQSTDAISSNVKHIQVNTVIAMKGNMELLEASSSLTLVDDALARSTFDVNIDSRTETSQDEKAKSPVKVIYKVDKNEIIEKLDSDFTSNDELDEKPKTKKRIYSSTKRDKHKYCTISNLDITPKPTTKMQKLSDSPVNYKAIVPQSSENPETNEKSKKKSPRKSKSKKPGTSITVQQLMTEYDVGPIDHEALDQQIKNVLRDPKSDTSSVEPASQSEVQDVQSLDMVSSFTSSKNLRDDRSVTTHSSKVSKMEWQPELIERLSSNVSNECEPSVNVVAKLDMLPFMGSHECEWDSSGGDTWSFRLLHSRLRLLVRLAHRHDNATRTRVLADTPVRSVQLEILPNDSKNTLAALCVTFAAETMRYFIGRGCACAGDVPALVRRCAAAARLAARWGRVMCEARHHLAYCVAPDGHLTLKVANIPLRCVWEVSMRLELVVVEAREAPWVCAGGVRVRRVLPAAERAPPPPPPVAHRLRHLPRDWSHAPRTLWRVFKYLKHKTRDDDELFMEN